MIKTKLKIPMPKVKEPRQEISKDDLEIDVVGESYEVFLMCKRIAIFYSINMLNKFLNALGFDSFIESED